MKSFSQVSTNTKAIAENLVQNGSTSSMHPLGCTTTDGKTITQPQNLQAEESNQSLATEIELSRQRNAVSNATRPNYLALQDDAVGKKEMAAMLVMFYESLKTYGKQPEHLDSCISMFQFVLADYSFDDIREAMAYYAKHYNEFPAPADIANIIERGGRPPLDRSVYVTISKKHPEDRDSSDWEYMREYEKFMMIGNS